MEGGSEGGGVPVCLFGGVLSMSPLEGRVGRVDFTGDMVSPPPLPAACSSDPLVIDTNSSSPSFSLWSLLSSFIKALWDDLDKEAASFASSSSLSLSTSIRRLFLCCFTTGESDSNPFISFFGGVVTSDSSFLVSSLPPSTFLAFLFEKNELHE